MKISLTMLIITTLLLAPFYVYSQEAPEDSRKRISRVLSMSVYKGVDRAAEAIRNEDYQSAEQELKKLLNKRLKLYDQAKIYELFTSVYIGKNQYELSVEMGEKALASQALGESEHIQMINRLFYLHYRMEQYSKAIDYFNRWQSLDPDLNADAYFTAARLYLITEDLAEALKYAQQGMTTAQANSDTAIQEHWYQLLIAIHIRLKNYEEAKQALELAITHWPAKADYYRQLSGIYQELKQEKESWAILSVAYKNRLLDGENDITRLSQQYRYHNYPVQGAEVLAQAMEQKQVEPSESIWESLSYAWMQAREWPKSETALFKAAKLSTNGKHWVALCQMAFEDERWTEAQNHCKAALRKGQLKEKLASTWYLLGLSQYYDKQLDLAQSSFERCMEWDETKSNCEYWQQHIAELI